MPPFPSAKVICEKSLVSVKSSPAHACHAARSPAAQQCDFIVRDLVPDTAVTYAPLWQQAGAYIKMYRDHVNPRARHPTLDHFPNNNNLHIVSGALKRGVEASLIKQQAFGWQLARRTQSRTQSRAAAEVSTTAAGCSLQVRHGCQHDSWQWTTSHRMVGGTEPLQN